MNDRNIKDGHFCWQSKEVLFRIGRDLEPGSATSAKMVYVALSWIASNEGSETFKTPIGYIAHLASLDRRTVMRRLPDLERLGLVSIERRKIEGTKGNEQNVYTLVTLSHYPSDLKSSPSDLKSEPGDSVRPLRCHSFLRTEESKKEEEGGACAPDPSLPPEIPKCNGNAELTPGNAGNARQRKMKMKKKKLPPEVQKWNSHGELPAVLSVSRMRLVILQARRVEPFFSQHWEAAIERICKSDFCLGQNDRGWKADFDWFLKPDNVARVMEGKYDNRAATKPEPLRNAI